MIREFGKRPVGVREIRRVSDATTEVYLGSRKLFELPDYVLISAEEVVVDWDDLDRFSLADVSLLEGTGP